MKRVNIFIFGRYFKPGKNETSSHMGNLLRFLISKTFYINLLVILLLLGAGIWGLFYWLGVHTQHNDTITVPNFLGQPIDSLERFASSRELQYVIIDTVDKSNQRRGTVHSQVPIEGSQVKRGRKIYLSVYALEARLIAFDYNYAGTTFRIAQKRLKDFPLTYEYEPGDEDQVLEVRHVERVLEYGDKIREGAPLTVVVGNGDLDSKVGIPDLIGLTYEQVLEELDNRGLNLGVFEMTDCENPEDSAQARVFSQEPEFDEKKAMPRGRAILLQFSLDAPMPAVPDSTRIDSTNQP